MTFEARETKRMKLLIVTYKVVMNSKTKMIGLIAESYELFHDWLMPRQMVIAARM